MKSERIISFIPLFLAIALIIGFFVGTNFNGDSSISSEQKEKLTKLNGILQYIDENYVDDVDEGTLVEGSIASILKDLDPHSVYIPARNSETFNEALEGHFDGVGIQFRIYHDTLMVVRVIEGGPSERAGLKAGDRIVKVNNEQLAGTDISNQDVLSKLKGQSGSIVKVQVLRQQNEIDFRIRRGPIPLRSIEAYYMLSDETGYIHLTKFSRTTTEEFIHASTQLRSRGMRKMVLDLRGNSGGFLNEAVGLADQFLSANKLIVYTEGRKRTKQEYRASSRGALESMPLTVLIDEGSASASEILAGAMQDNDRGLVVGRRSFGKGLVQERHEMPDKSELRLTIARYYTPAGRCIQRPYGEGIDYADEHYDRFENGELYQLDSSSFADSLKYHTIIKKRTVYGGGGITPDYFVPFDSSDLTLTLRNLRYFMDEYIFYFLDNKRDEILSEYGTFRLFGDEFEVSDEMINGLLTFAKDSNGVSIYPQEFDRSFWRIEMDMKEEIASHLFGFIGRSYVRARNDKTVEKARELIIDA